GDGTTDDTTGLNRAFSLLGKVIYLPKGSYRVTSNLAVPVCSGITGEGENISILDFSTGMGITTGLSLARTTVMLRDFQILGNAASGAIGIVFGDTASGAYDVQRVRVKNWTGVGAYGAKFYQCLKSDFIKLTIELCNGGALIDGSGTGFPTTL